MMLLKLPLHQTGVTEVVMMDQRCDAGMDHGVIGHERLEESNSSVAKAMVHQKECCMMVGFKPFMTQLGG